MLIRVSLMLDRERSTKVDAWGKLITPLGSFDVIRLVSTVNEYDRIELPFQTPIEKEHSYKEYYWWSVKASCPIMKAYVSEENGVVISYLNKLGEEGIEESAYLNSAVQIGPNPVKEDLNIGFSQSVNLNGIDVYDLNGRLITSQSIAKRMNAGEKLCFSSNELNLYQGIYLLKLRTEQGLLSRKIVVE